MAFEQRSANGRAPSPAQRETSLVVPLPASAVDVEAAVARLRSSLPNHGCPVVICDAGCIVDPDLATIDRLARLQLLVRRLGAELRLRNPSAEIRQLLDLAGLAGVIVAETR